MQAVYTIPNDRLTKKKEFPSSGMTFDIHVNSLEELNNKEKIELLFKDKNFEIISWLSFIDYFLLPKPVSVRKNESGQEVVVYNSSLMELNKPYEITWEGEKWALNKTEKDIEFQKWEPYNTDEKK